MGMTIKEISRNEETDKSCLRLSVTVNDLIIKKSGKRNIISIENISDDALFELGRHIDAIKEGRYSGFSQ